MQTHTIMLAIYRIRPDGSFTRLQTVLMSHVILCRSFHYAGSSFSLPLLHITSCHEENRGRSTSGGPNTSRSLRERATAQTTSRVRLFKSGRSHEEHTTVPDQRSDGEETSAEVLPTGTSRETYPFHSTNTAFSNFGNSVMYAHCSRLS